MLHHRLMLGRHICISLATTLIIASSALASPPHCQLSPLPVSVLDKIELQLRASPCVGDLRRWDRRYTYHEWMHGTVYSLDFGTIDFKLSEAGKYEFKSGRRFIDGALTGPDDRAYKVVFGSYDLLRNRLTIDQCGANM